MQKRLVSLILVLGFQAGATEETAVKSPEFLQKAVSQSVKNLLESNKTAFCESYEDFEDCPPNEPGPDSTDDGDGGREGDDSGPDDVGDGF